MYEFPDKWPFLPLKGKGEIFYQYEVFDEPQRITVTTEGHGEGNLSAVAFCLGYNLGNRTFCEHQLHPIFSLPDLFNMIKKWFELGYSMAQYNLVQRGTGTATFTGEQVDGTTDRFLQENGRRFKDKGDEE